MMDCERRYTQRYVMRVPFAFQPVAPVKLAVCSGEIIDISAHGMRFSTYSAVASGTTVKLFLKLPRDVIGRPSPAWRWLGKVVHVRSRATGGVEMGVQFIACEGQGQEADV